MVWSQPADALPPAIYDHDHRFNGFSFNASLNYNGKCLYRSHFDQSNQHIPWFHLHPIMIYRPSFFDRFVLLPNSDQWYQMKQSLSILIPMTKSCIYKGIYTFYQYIGLVSSLVTQDVFHLNLVTRQIYWKNICKFFMIRFRWKQGVCWFLW